MNSLVAKPERWLIDRLCAAFPSWITPDGLTFLGLVGAFIVLAGYALSNWSLLFLWLAVFGYALHWLGDSLDGSLARYRHIERPQYGYFIDHSTDALGNMLIAVGLGLSVAVRMDVALFSLVGYFMLSIYVFLKRQVLNEFQLTFFALGPTEIRIVLVGLTGFMPFMSVRDWDIEGKMFSMCDIFIASAGVIFVCIFIVSVLQTVNRLSVRF